MMIEMMGNVKKRKMITMKNQKSKKQPQQMIKTQAKSKRKMVRKRESTQSQTSDVEEKQGRWKIKMHYHQSREQRVERRDWSRFHTNQLEQTEKKKGRERERKGERKE